MEGSRAAVRTTTLPGRFALVAKRNCKAKCADNQEMLDKLVNEADEVQSKNPNSKYIHTLRKAIKSIADCKTQITNQKASSYLLKSSGVFLFFKCSLVLWLWIVLRDQVRKIRH